MSNIQNVIACNLMTYRKKNQLSLDKMSKLTNVSKNMLSQIERGESNPTITTLWKIANGLHLSLSELTTQQQDNVNFIDSTDILPIEDDNVVVYPYFPYDRSRQFEMFKMEIQPGCETSSEGHHLNSEEFIIVNKGVLTIIVNDEIYHINETQALRFNSDITHTYQNNTAELITFTATIYYQ